MPPKPTTEEIQADLNLLADELKLLGSLRRQLADRLDAALLEIIDHGRRLANLETANLAMAEVEIESQDKRLDNLEAAAHRH